jgi:hypothetical protein
MGSQGSSRRIFSCSSSVLRMILARSGARLLPISQGFSAVALLSRRPPSAPRCLPLFGLAGNCLCPVAPP